MWHIAYLTAIQAATLLSFSLLIQSSFLILAALVVCFVKGEWELLAPIRAFIELTLVATPFSVLGIVSGVLTGISRDSAVAALVPAVLTFVGGFIVLQLSQPRAMLMLSCMAALFFSTMLLIGTLFGSTERELHIAGMASLAHKYEDIEIEFLTERYRKALGLPPAIKETDGDTKDAKK